MTELLPLDDLGLFVSTRESLHRVAEHVVAKTRFLDDREIRLTAFPGGFATPPLSDGTRVRVDIDHLVIDAPSGSRRSPLTTIGNAAAFAGIEPGFPTELYEPATSFDPDQPLSIDRRSAEVLAAWYGFTAEVLAAFATEIADAHPSQLILWPEHFDQAFFTEDTDEARRANYGASPGDEGHPEPYMYVGPWGPTASNDYWNAATFNGAVLALSELLSADDASEVAMQFLREGRTLLASASGTP
jgi:hypothetical protein